MIGNAPQAVRSLRTPIAHHHAPFRIHHSQKHIHLNPLRPMRRLIQRPTTLVQHRTLSTSIRNISKRTVLFLDRHVALPIYRTLSHPFIISCVLLTGLLIHVGMRHIRFVYGPSMLPTIPAKDGLVWVSLSYNHGRGIQVGDLVAAKHPFVEHEHLVKRVIGMPGDYVSIRGLVQDDELESSFGGFEVEEVAGKRMLLVPAGHVYVEGDNPPASNDSRLYGPIPMALVWGKVTWMVYLAGGWFKFEWIKNGLVPCGSG